MGFVLYEMCYSCSKGLEPVETFITELKEDWSSESPKGFTKKIKRFGKLLTRQIDVIVIKKREKISNFYLSQFI